MIVSVVGLGETARDWHKVKADLSIGVNDVEKFGHPVDWLLLANWPQKFPTHRLNIIRSSIPKRLFYSTDQWQGVFFGGTKIRLNSWDGHLYNNRKDEFSSSHTSPFIAMSMAYKAGADDIILWGVEFINHATYGKDNPQTRAEVKTYKQMVDALKVEGVNVWLGKEGSLLEEFVSIWKG